MRRVVTGVAVAVALALAACGSTDSDVSPTAEEALAAPVAELRYTATAGDLAAAQERVAAIRAKVDELEGTGDLTKEAATRIRRAVDDVERRLPSIATGSTPSSSTATQPGKGGKEKKKPKGDKGG